jgi:sugar (pentulose or hexulose) kinase
MAGAEMVGSSVVRDEEVGVGTGTSVVGAAVAADEDEDAAEDSAGAVDEPVSDRS